MGLTNEYDRYVSVGHFNVITSAECNVDFVVINHQMARFVAAAACEDVIIWDLKLNSQHLTLKCNSNHQVTSLRSSPSTQFLAVGYENGIVNLFDLHTGEINCTFSGHISAITCLDFDKVGYRLATGSKDNNIIVWDIISERGLMRFNEHTNAVTQIKFLKDKNVLISASKDMLLKFWDLNTQYCFKILTGHRSEVWDFLLMKGDKYLITGSNDSELRVWELFAPIEKDQVHPDEFCAPIDCAKMGSIIRESSERVLRLVADSSQKVFGCIAGNKIELLEFRDDISAEQKRIKRLKKTGQSLDEPVNLVDEVIRLTIIKSFDKKARFKSVSLHLNDLQSEIRVAVNINWNMIEMYSVELSKTSTAQKLKAVTKFGHRSEVRCLRFSHDCYTIASGSHESIKIWNKSSQASIATINVSDSVTALLFAAYSKHLVASLRDGRILIVDLSLNEVIEQIPAHNSLITSMCLFNDIKYVLSGSHDCSVKFWKFELVQGRDSNNSTTSIRIQTSSLSLVHERTLKLDEKVLCVKVSPNNKFLAVSLLDSTVKIFFMDTLKIFLHLYGHRLPVLCMDIAHDSSIIVTGSSDKNIKIWGLDFGDCRKSIFAHGDVVTALEFVPKSLLLFSCGKDGKVKQWDMKSFSQISVVQEHKGEAYGLAVSPNGNHVISCGLDRMLRLLEKTNELLILEDEAQEQRAKQDEAQLISEGESLIPSLPKLNLPSRRSVNSEQAASDLFECLRVCQEYENQLQDKSDAAKIEIQIPVEMQIYKVNNVADYLIEILRRIKSGDMEEALIRLSFMNVMQLFDYLPSLLEMRTNDQFELLANVAVFLLKGHHKTFIHNKTLILKLKEIASMVSFAAKDFKNLIRDMEASKIRGTIKGQLTRIENFINERADDASEFELRVRLEKLPALFDRFTSTQDDIELKSNADNLPNEELERENFENRFYTLEAKYKSKIQGDHFKSYPK